MKNHELAANILRNTVSVQEERVKFWSDLANDREDECRSKTSEIWELQSQVEQLEIDLEQALATVKAMVQFETDNPQDKNRSLQVQVEQMNDKLEVLWEER